MPRPGYQKKDGVSHPLSRRTVLKSILGVGLGLQFVGAAVSTAEEVSRARPQVGDLLVFSLGERRGQLITPQDLPLEGPSVIAYPLDPGTQTVRDGSRLNAVLLVRFAQEELSEPTRAVAAEGIVGYSAICTHAGCEVSGWKGENKCLVCPCHISTFDPKDRARIVSGPAPRPLAALPLQLRDGKVTVAGAFSGRVGAVQP
jgi:Rieske Fe-S protein